MSTISIQHSTTENGVSITGLSQQHINILKQVLQTCVLGADMLREMSQTEKRHYFQSFNANTPLSEQEINHLVRSELESANLINEILKGLS